MDERLRKLVYLVETGSFTKAAALLHVSQPALSLAIKTLERELGVDLLIRSGRQLQLTDAGQIVYESALRIDGEVDGLHAQLRTLAGQKPKIAIGMIDSIAEIAFEPADGFAAVAEQTQLSLIIDTSQRLIEAFAQGKLDVVFITGASASLGIEPLLLVAHPSQVTSIRESLKDGILPNFISYNQGSRTFELISKHFSENNIAFRPTSYSTSPTTMLQLVLSNHGVAALPYTTIANALTDKQLIAIPVGAKRIIDRPIEIMQVRNKTLPDSVIVGIESLRNLLVQGYELALAYASPSVWSK